MDGGELLIHSKFFRTANGDVFIHEIPYKVCSAMYYYIIIYDIFI